MGCLEITAFSHSVLFAVHSLHPQGGYIWHLHFFKANTKGLVLELTYLNKLVSKTLCPFVSLQAMIGVAFSLGFTLGPMIGAYLAMETEKGEVFYLRSALLALTFAAADLIFIFFLLPETLPKEKRVSRIWECRDTGCNEERAEPVSQEFSSFLGLAFTIIKVVVRWSHLPAQCNMRNVCS